MTNSGAPPPGATIVQYAAQSADGTQQFFVPGSQVVVQGIFYYSHTFRMPMDYYLAPCSDDFIIFLNIQEVDF